jgi:hypothetical protein
MSQTYDKQGKSTITSQSSKACSKVGSNTAFKSLFSIDSLLSSDEHQKRHDQFELDTVADTPSCMTSSRQIVTSLDASSHHYMAATAAGTSNVLMMSASAAVAPEIMPASYGWPSSSQYSLVGPRNNMFIL